MARYPGAKWEPITGHTNGPMRSYLGVVLHCNDAQSLDLHDFFQRSSGDSAVSSHFQVTKAGDVYQYLDTAVTSWCQRDGNDDYLSIESQGLAGEQATAAQVAAIGGILRWCKSTHGIPLQLADVPGQRGFGWHGMGAANGFNWGHALCPGVRKAQRPAMLAAAGNPTVPEDDMYDAAAEKRLIDHIDDRFTSLIKGDVDAKGDPLPPATNTHAVNLTFADARQRRIEAAQDPAAFAAAVAAKLAPLVSGGLTQAQIEAALLHVLHNA